MPLSILLRNIFKNGWSKYNSKYVLANHHRFVVIGHSVPIISFHENSLTPANTKMT